MIVEKSDSFFQRISLDSMKKKFIKFDKFKCVGLHTVLILLAFEEIVISVQKYHFCPLNDLRVSTMY